jgi:hypothetical protein
MNYITIALIKAETEAELHYLTWRRDLDDLDYYDYWEGPGFALRRYLRAPDLAIEILADSPSTSALESALRVLKLNSEQCSWIHPAVKTDSPQHKLSSLTRFLQKEGFYDGGILGTASGTSRHAEPQGKAVSTKEAKEEQVIRAVLCANGCNDGEPIQLSDEEYLDQISRGDKPWLCPVCRVRGRFVDVRET